MGEIKNKNGRKKVDTQKIDKIKCGFYDLKSKNDIFRFFYFVDKR